MPARLAKRVALRENPYMFSNHPRDDDRDASNARPSTGRAAQIAPANRFETTRLVDDFEHLDDADESLAERRAPTEFFADDARSILRENDSPDIPFRYSINPYRGCEHGCAYCYARPGHETLGLNAGIDFETKILVKHNAAELLRRELTRPSWSGECIAISGVTDCYQPVERRLRLTRACLKVLHEARQPCGIVTKNALVTRDLDLLASMAAGRTVHVAISVTTLDQQLARTLEPRTSSPAARLSAIAELTAAGVSVRVMAAPIIPGLNDQELPAILKAARAAGAAAASYILLRLPLTVRPVFEDWLERNLPLKKPRIEALIRETRGGRMSDSKFGRRMRGEGAYAEQIQQTFDLFSRKLGLDGPLPPLDSSNFRPPRIAGQQQRLF
jgi:DNA repair photolyase